MEEAEALCDRVAIIDRGRLVVLDTPGALINRLAGLSSITTSANMPLEVIRSLPAISSAQRDGAQMRLQTSDVATTLRSFLDLAEEYEVSVHDLHIKQPNLEEVFLNLTGRAIRA